MPSLAPHQATVQLFCQYITVSSHDGTSRELIFSTSAPQQKHQSHVYHQPLCQLLFISRMQQKHPSFVWIRTLCQRLNASPYAKLVSSGKQVLELWPILFRSVDFFPSVRLLHRFRRQWHTTATHHKRRLSNVPILSGITRPKVQQPCSRECVQKPLPPLIQSGLQNPMVPTKPLEILVEEATRIVRSDGGEEEPETVTEHEDSHQDAAPRRGAVSVRRRARLRQVVGHLMRCSSSATSASLLEHCALRALAKRKLYQQTLEHFLTCVAKRMLPILKDTDGYAAYRIQQRQYMFGVQHHRDNTQMAAFMHRYPR